MKNIEDREADFKKEVHGYTEFDYQLRETFFNYWSEHNRSNTKMKWELEKTWEIKKRLFRFHNNQYHKYGATIKKGTSSDRITGLKNF